MKPSDILEQHRETIRNVVKANRAKNARVFGSALHGSDSENSDLDVLIDPTESTTLFDIGAIKGELSDILGINVGRAYTYVATGQLPRYCAVRGERNMSSDPQRVRDLLKHILHAIDRINDYTKYGESEFMSNKMVQDAVIRNFEVIGEASRNIEKRFPEFARNHSDLPLRSAYEMRNALAHGYFKIDLAIVWRTIDSDLPKLRERVAEALSASE